MATETQDYTNLKFLRTTLIFSFCADGNLLSQWRAYGKRGAGCAIGFHQVPLQKAAKKRGFNLLRVIYDSKRQRELLTHFFQAAQTIALKYPADEHGLWTKALSFALS
jgi:hypothetical protein